MTKRILWVAVVASLPAVAEGPAPAHPLPQSDDGSLVVGLCDGKTSLEVKGKRPGDALAPEEAKGVADQLMADWRQKNPATAQAWSQEELLAQAQPHPPPAPGGPQQGPRSPSQVPPSPQQPAASPSTSRESASTGATGISKNRPDLQTGQTYGAFSARDEKIWAVSTQQFVEEGNRIFHDAKQLGGTVGISCDMCHPNAANTHPETYPKYQVQLGKVALLRDMINWCIENPVRGKPLADGDPKLKALEAFILAQRKGTPLEYGKH